MIIIDMIVALALGTLFIAVISTASLSAHDLYTYAHTREGLIERYTSGGFDETARPYGNDRTEYADTIHDSSSTLSFIRVASTTPLQRSGSPLCSADLTSHDIVGSYAYLEARDSTSTTAFTAAITPVLLPVSPLLPLTDLEIRHNIAYISADSAKASDPDLLIVDISDPKNPVLLSSLDTGPGISSIALSGTYIYAAAASTAAQLHVVKLTDLHSPMIATKFKLPLPYATATPPFGTAISYSDGYVYLGTEKWDGDEFSVIDVNNPAVPKKTGGFDADSKVNDIHIDARDHLAYVADADIAQLRTIDVHDPNDPVLGQTFSPSGWQRQEGTASNLFEGALAFARTSGGFDIATDPELMTWSSSTVPSLSNPSVQNIPGGVYGLMLDRRHAYAVTRNLDHEFSVFDRRLTASSSEALPVAPQTLTCDGSTIYILAHTAPALYEITFP